MDTLDTSQIRLPESALAEFAAVEEHDWGEGVTLSALVDWINLIEDQYRPLQTDARSSPRFSERSLRHYQTLGCIDAPNRVGKRAMYGFRQYLQALVVRKFIWERVPSDKIVLMMQGKSNEEYKALLFQGIEIIDGDPSEADSGPTNWQRYSLSDGLELHINRERATPTAAEIRNVLGEVERILKGK